MSKQLDKYVRATVPEQYRILGVRLKPLSLGHLILMKRYECAFAEDSTNTKAGVWDLLLGVAICSRSFQEFVDWFGDDERRDAWLTEWYKSIMWECKNTKGWNILHKFTLFNSYRREGIEVPLFFDESKTDDMKESGAHWIQNVITTLVTKGRFSETEIYDVPLAKALSEYFKILENEGLISFMTDWQIAEAQKAKEASK